MTDLHSIGLIGLGNMGTPMATRLLAAGIPVTGFDLSEERRAALEGLGGRAVGTPAEVVESVDAVILMLPDSQAVASVIAGIRDGLRPGLVVIDMGSSEPAKTRALAADLEGVGVELADAPVSGGVAGAEKGTLTIMAGGTGELVGRITPILEHLGTVRHAGPVGAGHAVKALNNLVSATHLWVTSEAVIAGERFGLDPEVMLKIINGSSGRSGSSENKWPNFILPGTFDSGFGLRLMLKDMRIAVALAEQLGVSVELGEAAVERWAKAAGDLAPEADHTEVAKWLGKRGRGLG